jgi:DNA-binding NtrC family response regulator
MKKTRILYIEDDLVDRMAFQRFAEEKSFPYEFVMAMSIADAGGLLKSEGFDLVIADYRLGDGTAFDILELNSVPVIIATGAGSEQIAVQAMKAGAYDYLIKDLTTIISTSCGRARGMLAEGRRTGQDPERTGIGKRVIIGGDSEWQRSSGLSSLRRRPLRPCSSRVKRARGRILWQRRSTTGAPHGRNLSST